MPTLFSENRGLSMAVSYTQISHVIKAIGVPEEYAKGTIRISLGKDNTKEEVNTIIAALVRILRDR